MTQPPILTQITSLIKHPNADTHANCFKYEAPSTHFFEEGDSVAAQDLFAYHSTEAVPIIYEGPYSYELIQRLAEGLRLNTTEPGSIKQK
jgi:hypothetical protein